MSDLLYDDPLHDAVCTALVASGPARQALEALAVFLPRYRSLCASLSRRALAHDLFENRDRYDLETLLDRVDREIRAGERIEVHADEHCVSGGWLETVLTPDARKLQDTAAPVRRLLNALEQVHALRRSETMTARLREADM